MSEENEALVRSAYEAYGQGDVTRLLEMVHPIWSGPISIPASLTRSRRSATVGTSWRGRWGVRPTGA